MTRKAALALLALVFVAGCGVKYADTNVPQVEKSRPAGGGQNHPPGVSDAELKTMAPPSASPTQGK